MIIQISPKLSVARDLSQTYRQTEQGLCSSAGSARWPTNPVN